MPKIGAILIMLSIIFVTCSNKGKNMNSIVWDINNLENIGGNSFTMLGSPVVFQTASGNAVQFDGKEDALIFDTNPLSGFKQFTLEIIFRPDANGLTEQRFFHLQGQEDHRVLVESRLTEDGQWFLDTYIKNGDSDCTLYAQEFTHPVGQWYHAALVYDGKEMRHYVNGQLELSGIVDYAPMQGGQTSLGVRLNRVCWFKGAIHKTRVTPKVLQPDEFLKLTH